MAVLFLISGSRSVPLTSFFSLSLSAVTNHSVCIRTLIRPGQRSRHTGSLLPWRGRRYRYRQRVRSPFYGRIILGNNRIFRRIFGAYNPAGRLPYTIYPPEYVNQISMLNMNMRAPPGRTYRFYTGTVRLTFSRKIIPPSPSSSFAPQPQWPFGWGLSYTVFNFSWSTPVEETVRVLVSFIHKRKRSNIHADASHFGPREAVSEGLGLVHRQRYQHRQQRCAVLPLCLVVPRLSCAQPETWSCWASSTTIRPALPFVSCSTLLASSTSSRVRLLD